MSFMPYILNICIFMPILLGLFLIVTKLTSEQYSKLNNKKHVKVLEKTFISKDTYSLVMKIGESGYVGISSPSGFQMIKELNSVELASLEPTINPREDIDYIKNLTPILKTIGVNTKTIIQKITKNIQANKAIKEGETRWK